MKNKILAVLLLFIISPSFSQNCKCEDELTFVVNYYEENLPGFSDNVNETNLSDYNEFRKNLFKQTRAYCEDEEGCYKTLLTYVEFFKDNHSSIYMNNAINVDENNPEEVDEFMRSAIYRNREFFEEFDPQKNKSLDSIENVYETADKVYKVAIVKSKNDFRDYVGIILNSKAPLWKKGQVKFELKKTGSKTYDMFLYMRNHALRFRKNVKLKNGVLDDIWFNVRSSRKKTYSASPNSALLFKEIDSETNYMYIPTFRGDWYAKLSDFYANNDSLVQSKPYLIIDVRGNGGGSDACVIPLLKYIYTKPFRDDDVDIYATKENIRKAEEWYADMEKDTANFSREFLQQFSEEIERMKAAPNKTFIPRSEGEIIELEEVLENPEKVAVITNRYCASSCETLLFWALESDKTIIVGENSGGYVGYGEIGETLTPNFNFSLGCTMTRYNYQRQYEVDGVPPAVYLNQSEDWIKQTVKLLNPNYALELRYEGQKCNKISRFIDFSIAPLW